MAEESRFVVFARARLLNVGHSQLRLAHQSQSVEWKVVLLKLVHKSTFSSNEGSPVIPLIKTFIWPINEGCERQLLLIIWKNLENAFISKRWPCASFKQSTNSIWPSFCPLVIAAIVGRREVGQNFYQRACTHDGFRCASFQTFSIRSSDENAEANPENRISLNAIENNWHNP